MCEWAENLRLGFPHFSDHVCHTHRDRHRNIPTPGRRTQILNFPFAAQEDPVMCARSEVLAELSLEEARVSKHAVGGLSEVFPLGGLGFSRWWILQGWFGVVSRVAFTSATSCWII